MSKRIVGGSVALLLILLAASFASLPGSEGRARAAPAESSSPCNSGASTNFGLESTIAFSSTRDTSTATTPPQLSAAAEIYLMSPDGSNPRRLTDNQSGDGFPDLSPDGTKIVFDRLSGQINVSDLFLMNADGSEQTFLTRGSSATWSPDCKEIAFHASASGTGTPIRQNPGSATTDSDIFVANVDDLLSHTAGPRNLTRSDHVIDEDADWSPDGQRIVYTAHPDTYPAGDSPNLSNQAEIYVINADGSGTPTRLTFNNEEERGPAWSPDGTRIVYSCRIGGGNHVFQICVINAALNPDGTPPVPAKLTDDTVQNLTATWSPDGQQIVFNKLLPQVVVPGEDTPKVNYQLFTISPSLNPDGSMPTAQEITCAPQQQPPYPYPCPQGISPVPGINLIANWGQLRVHLHQ